MAVPEEGVLPPTERVVTHRHGDGDVHTHHPGLAVELERARGATVAREDRCAVAVGIVVHQRERLLVAARAHHGQHRPEDLVAVAVHLRRDVVDQRDAEEEAVGHAVEAVLAAVLDDRRALLLSRGEVARDLVAMLARDEGAHLGLGFEAVADLHQRQPPPDGVDERVGDVADGHDHRDRHAALTGGSVGGGNRRVGRHVEVRVGQHHHVVLGTAQRLHALPVGRTRRVDVLRDGCGSDETDRPDARVLEQAVHHDLVAVDHVEDAIGQARLLQELRDVHRCPRILLGRLQDERVPARDGVGEHPHGHHGREVERRDARHHPKRLTDREDVHAGGRLLRESTLQQVRDAGRELDVLQAARHLAHGVGEHLAVLLGDEPRDVLAMLMQRLADPEQDVGPFRQRRPAPAGERLLRGRDGGVHLAGAREVDLVRLPARGRVEHGAGAPGLAGDGLPSDPMADAIHGHHSPAAGRQVRARSSSARRLGRSGPPYAVPMVPEARRDPFRRARARFPPGAEPAAEGAIRCSSA